MNRLIVLTTVIFLLVAGVAQSDLLVTGSSGDLAASANFHISGSDLIITLTNTSTKDVPDPAHVLTAFFFNVSSNPALTPVSAVLNAGSTVLYDPDGQPAGGVVGGEWEYLNNLTQYNANEGIGSSGFNIFGSPNFPGPDLAPPSALDGANYGLLSAGFDPNNTSANTGVTGSGGLIKNSVVFDLSGLPAGFALTDLSHFTFQYGTDLTEPHVPGGGGGGGGGSVPEPGTIVLLGSGLVGLGLYGRLRIRK